MNFRTQVELPKREAEIRHSDRIMLFGSCFAENIGNLLLTNKFRCDVNPFGILYNPLSVDRRGIHVAGSSLANSIPSNTYGRGFVLCRRLLAQLDAS